VLAARGGYEAPFIRRVGELAMRVALVPWLAEAPVGGAGLAGMVRA
jgi:arsenite-transporting ATPase